MIAKSKSLDSGYNHAERRIKFPPHPPSPLWGETKARGKAVTNLNAFVLFITMFFKPFLKSGVLSIVMGSLHG
jgi:hypothetical protein